MTLLLQKTTALTLLLSFLIYGVFPSVIHAETETPPEVTESVPEETVEEPPEPGETEENTDGSDGDEGESGGETVIVTGDAKAGSETENEVNTNDTNTEATGQGGEETTPEEAGGTQGDTNDNNATTTDEHVEEPNASSTLPQEIGENASSTQEVAATSTDGTAPQVFGDTPNGTNTASTTASTTVTSENEAEVENTVEVEAETGENEAAGEEAVVVTGDAFAYANVVNIVNTNIVNSDGFLLFFNQFFGVDSFDLRDVFTVFEDTPIFPTPCSLSSCEDGDVELTVENDNTATITNDVVVRSSTGGNGVEGGSTSISTGDAYAAANVVNVANTNIVDTNYLMLAFNNFGDFGGDLVLPGRNFFEDLFTTGEGTGLNQTFINDNTATVTNSVGVKADTGGNTATSSEDGAYIGTGDSTAQANVIDQINTNVFGGDSFMLLFKIHGDWSGDVLGLPQGVSWAETPDGIKLYSDDGYSASQSTPSAAASVSNTNNALIKNNVQAFALTGENKADGDNAAIETGNAYAGANVLNVANTNVMGRNWALLVFNIFGDWDGDIAFGRPDLWLGSSAMTSDPSVGPGARMVYTFTVANNGDTDATDVVLENDFAESLLAYSIPPSWHIGTIRAGEAVEVSYEAHVSQKIPSGQTPITTTAKVKSRETDDNMEDNTDVLTVMAERFYNIRSDGSSSFRSGAKTPKSDLQIEKIANVATSTASSSVDYTITIKNTNNGSAYHAELIDELVSEDGTLINQQYWDLGEIFPEEEITVTYTTLFSSTTVPGTYTNYAKVYAFDTYQSLDLGRIADSNMASSHITIIGEESGEVLGVLTEDVAQQCTQYLTEFMRYQATNNPAEVTKLQEFLKNYEAADVGITGTFDIPTADAVKAFQRKYHADILDPWGIQNETGYVYYTTQKKINELHCNNAQNFPLTFAQIAEIDAYKSTLFAKRNNDKSSPPPGTPDDATLPVAQISQSNISESQKQKEEDNPPQPKPKKRESFFKSFFSQIFSLVDGVARAQGAYFGE